MLFSINPEKEALINLRSHTMYFEGNDKNYTARCNWISFVLIHIRNKINKL